MPAWNRRLLALFLLSGWVTVALPLAAAQQGKPSPAKQSSSAGPASDQDQEYSFSVNVQVVTVPVTVTNQKGDFVTDLDKSDFTILDDGKQQRIENFELSSEPLSLAVLVDTSSRVQSLLPDVRNSGILITQLILGESGEAAVLTFDRDVRIAQDFTSDADKIEAAIKGLQPGGDQTRLSDAVARAVFLLQQRPRERRKVIVIISEARDQGSRNKLGMALRGAQQLGISVYSIGLSTLKALANEKPGENVASSPYPPGVVTRPTPGMVPPTPDTQTNYNAMNVNVLELISDLVTYTKSLITGNPLTVYAAGSGGADFPTDNKGKLEKALSRIGEELRNQYLLTYRPDNLDTTGFHTIQVNVNRRDLQARARPGYMLTPPVQSTPKSSGSDSENDPVVRR